MSSSAPEIDPRATEVRCSEDELLVQLGDGRSIAVPLAWFPRLLHATAAQRANVQLLGDGRGLHWPDVDEDLRVEGLLRGARSPEP
jgi:hypothetical protein